MKFTPMNKHVEVEPIEDNSIIHQQNSTFEEKGTVISYDEDNCEMLWDEGDIVYFDSWMVAKYMDSTGKERYLVPEEAIRAYETKD